MRFQAYVDGRTLDNSIPIIVYCGHNDEEYVFQFACNERELKELRLVTDHALDFFKKIKKEKKKMEIWRGHVRKK